MRPIMETILEKLLKKFLSIVSESEWLISAGSFINANFDNSRMP